MGQTPLPSSPPHALTQDDVRKVATLARLALAPAQVEAYRTQLTSVLALMDQLGELDLAGVEPLCHPREATNALRNDAPGQTLPNEAFMAIAPDTLPPFLKVPNVFGGALGGMRREGSGA